MNRSPHRLYATVLGLALLLSGVFAGNSAATRASKRRGAAQSDKVSRDLRERVRGGGGERVTVVVQPRGEWGDEQEGTLRAHGGRVKDKFENMTERVVELPARAVEALAARDDVEFVSPEREIVGSSRVDLQACKLEYSIVSPK